MAEKMLLIFAKHIRENDKLKRKLTDRCVKVDADVTDSVLSYLLSLPSDETELDLDNNDVDSKPCSLSDEDKIAMLARRNVKLNIENSQESAQTETCSQKPMFALSDKKNSNKRIFSINAGQTGRISFRNKKTSEAPAIPSMENVEHEDCGLLDNNYTESPGSPPFSRKTTRVARKKNGAISCSLSENNSKNSPSYSLHETINKQQRFGQKCKDPRGCMNQTVKKKTKEARFAKDLVDWSKPRQSNKYVPDRNSSQSSLHGGSRSGKDSTPSVAELKHFYDVCRFLGTEDVSKPLKSKQQSHSTIRKPTIRKPLGKPSHHKHITSQTKKPETKTRNRLSKLNARNNSSASSLISVVTCTTESSAKGPDSVSSASSKNSARYTVSASWSKNLSDNDQTISVSTGGGIEDLLTFLSENIRESSRKDSKCISRDHDKSKHRKRHGDFNDQYSSNNDYSSKHAHYLGDVKKHDHKRKELSYHPRHKNSPDGDRGDRNARTKKFTLKGLDKEEEEEKEKPYNTPHTKLNSPRDIRKSYNSRYSRLFSKTNNTNPYVENQHWSNTSWISPSKESFRQKREAHRQHSPKVWASASKESIRKTREAHRPKTPPDYDAYFSLESDQEISPPRYTSRKHASQKYDHYNSSDFESRKHASQKYDHHNSSDFESRKHASQKYDHYNSSDFESLVSSGPVFQAHKPISPNKNLNPELISERVYARKSIPSGNKIHHQSYHPANEEETWMETLSASRKSFAMSLSHMWPDVKRILTTVSVVFTLMLFMLIVRVSVGNSELNNPHDRRSSRY